jgi:hypothetical protein
MSLRINSRAGNFTAEKTHGKINLCQWMPEADAYGDLYGENGERMPCYPARPRQQPRYELSPEFGYGTVWLVGAGDGDPHRLPPLALHALATADAVIHDPAIPQPILDLVQPPRYREAVTPGQGTERSIKLAEDGWRVVRLVSGNRTRH